MFSTTTDITVRCSHTNITGINLFSRQKLAFITVARSMISERIKYFMRTRAMVSQ